MSDHERDAPTDALPEITPQVLHLIDLFKRVREGRLRVPVFQREYVWKREAIIDLFDSIVNQYPIGTLFLWGANPPPTTRPRIGPLRVPEPSGEAFLILDGQQRLTTLVGVLLADDDRWNPDENDADPGQWNLYYDAEEQVFTHCDVDPPPVHHVRVAAALDTMTLYAEAERMVKKTDENSRGKVRRWIQRAQVMAQGIQRYRIPIVEIKTNDLSIAVESFSRLNKKGRKVSADEMFSALTYERDSFHLAPHIDQLQREMIRSGFGEVDRTLLLRAVLTAARLDIYRTDWTRLGREMKKETRAELPRAVDSAREGLERTRGFLRGLGVLNARMLPYSMQLVALSAFFGRCATPTSAQRALLRRWLWSSSFAGWFGIANPAQVRRLVDEMRDNTAQNPDPDGFRHFDIGQVAMPTPLRFDLRSARVRALLCVLLARGPRKPDGTPLTLQDTADRLLERGPEAVTIACATVNDGDLRSSPANRIFDVAPEVAGQAKNWLVKLPEGPERDQILDSHAIPVDAYEALCCDDNDRFLRLRLAHLVTLEAEFLHAQGITPSKYGPTLAPLDEDGQAPLTDEPKQLYLF